MSPLKAHYFDGKRSTRHAVTVMISGGKLKVVGRDVSEEFDARRVRRSLRIADTPRWLYLPGGGVCVTSENDAVDRITRDRRYEALLHRWESHPAYAALAIALVVGALWLLVNQVLPVAVAAIAERIPVEAEAALGRQALAGMEQYFLKSSSLHPARQQALRGKFDAMARGAGEAAYRLEFRSSSVIGPNAFALPSGIVVVTDELVKFAASDSEVLAVLAHELGHIRHRHVMRRLLEGSATALIIAGVTGDITSAASLAAAAPTVLLHAKYSRDNEREADVFAIELMRKAGKDPRHLAAVLARLESDSAWHGGVPRFLSSHPPTAERQALAGQGAPLTDPAEAKERAEALAALPDRPKVYPADAVQGRVMDLLDLKEYRELETLLGEYQTAFENDPASSPKLENAYAVMSKVRKGTEAALDEWVRRFPRSYPALAARGNFHYWQAWDARGSASMRDTPDDRVRAMRVYLAKAKADLEQSLKLTGKPYMSHLMLMSVARTAGDRRAEKTHYLEAIKLAPGSVAPRLSHMRSLEPRWGGSYREMEAFLAETRQQSKDEGTVARVAARIPEYRGFESRRAGDYPQALAHYDEAIALHAGPDALCGRAYVLGQLNRKAVALRDVKLALSKARDHRDCLDLAVTLAPNISDNDEAIALLTLIIEVDLHSSKALNQRASRYFNQDGKLDLALQDFRASARLGDATGQIQVGNFYWMGKGGVEQDRDEAMSWFRKAAAQGEPWAKEHLEQMLKQYGQKDAGPVSSAIQGNARTRDRQ